MTTSSTPKVSPKKVGVGVWLVGFISLLVPFTIVGESWGMIWMYLAAPLSFFAEETVGVGRGGSVFLIVIVSAGAAAAWALLIYTLVRLFNRSTKVSSVS